MIRLLLLLAAALPAAAPAAVTVTFYSRDTGAVLENFPHGFVAVAGTPDAGGPAIDTNYGFTAKTVTPAILWGSVGGEIVTMSPAYVARSDPHMRFAISDADYARLVAVVEKWKALPAPSYNLRRQNCVFFVADVARALGLDAPPLPKLMLKPKSYLAAVTARNAAFLAERASAGAPLVDPAVAPPPLPAGAPRDTLRPAEAR